MSVCAREVAFKCTHWPLCHLWNLILSNALGQCTVNRNSGCMESGLRVCNSTIECNLNNCCRLKPVFTWNVSNDKNLAINCNLHLCTFMTSCYRLQGDSKFSMRIKSKVMIRALLVQCAMVVVTIESIDRYLHSKGPASYIIYQSGDNKNENTF